MRHDEFVERVRIQGGLTSRGEAEGVTRATLEALGERLSPDLVDALCTELPEPLRSHLRRSATSRDSAAAVTGELVDAGTFLQRVSERSRGSELPTPRAPATVMRVLDEAVPDELIREIRSALPADLAAALIATEGGTGAAPTDVIHRPGSSGVGRGSAPHAGVSARGGRRGDSAPGEVPHDALRGLATLGGLAVALSTWLALSLVLLGLGVVDPPGLWLGQPSAATAADWWSIAAMAVALIVGGMAAGLGTASARSDAALLQGVLVWALFIPTACLATWLDVGIDAGPVGRVIRQLGVMSSGALADGPAVAVIRASAGFAVVAVTVALITCCAGALIGWLLVTARDTAPVDGEPTVLPLQGDA